jgi:hypothetical protein
MEMVEEGCSIKKSSTRQSTTSHNKSFFKTFPIKTFFKTFPRKTATIFNTKKLWIYTIMKWETILTVRDATEVGCA